MRRPRMFYGWWIVAAGGVIALLQGGLYVYGFGVFYLPLLAALGSSRAALGGVLGLSQLQGGLIAPLAGWFIDRYGPRLSLFIGLTVMGMGFIALSRITALWMLYALFIVMSTASSLGGGRPVLVAVANWFVRKRGRAMGILQVGFGLGGSLSFALAWLINTFGWRTAAVVSGLLFWAIGYPLAWFFRHRPEQMGLLPDGASPAAQEELTPAAGREGEGPGEIELTPRQALKTRAFWMLAISFITWSTVVSVVTVYQIPFFTEEMGVPFVTAAAVASIFSAISIVGRVGFGWLGDLVNLRLLLAGTFLFQAIGLVALAQLPSLAWAPLYLIIFGLSYGGSLPLRLVIVAHFYGRRNFGTISGLLQFVDLPGAVLGPVFVGSSFDILGSYRPGFMAVAALMVIGAGAILAARRPQAQEAPQPAATT